METPDYRSQAKTKPPESPLPPCCTDLENEKPLKLLLAWLLKLTGRNHWGPPYDYADKPLDLTRAKRSRAVAIFIILVVAFDLGCYLAK